MEKSDPSVLQIQEWAREQKPNDQYVQDKDQICKPSINHNMSPSAEQVSDRRSAVNDFGSVAVRLGLVNLDVTSDKPDAVRSDSSLRFRGFVQGPETSRTGPTGGGLGGWATRTTGRP